MAAKEFQIKTKGPLASDLTGPVKIVINDGQKVPHCLSWMPDGGFEALSTVWGLMMVLIQGQFANGLRFTTWKRANATGKVQEKGVCSLLSREEQGPLLAPGETLTLGAVVCASAKTNDA